jgi:hypothetical protein
MTASALAEPLAELENTSATPDIQPLLTQLTGGKPCADILQFDRTWHSWSNGT